MSARRRPAEKNSRKTGAGRPFRKGQSGNPKGRPPGVPNKVTLLARAAAAQIVDDPQYRAKLLARARAGRLKPAIETMLWLYAKGKPVEHVRFDGEIALENNVIVYIPEKTGPIE